MYLGYYCYIHLPLVDFLPYKVGVNIREGMQAPGRRARASRRPCWLYRNRRDGPRAAPVLAGRHRAWQDAEKWEWVDTRTTDEMPAIRPLVSEFALRDAEGRRDGGGA